MSGIHSGFSLRGGTKATNACQITGGEDYSEYIMKPAL